MHQLATDDKVLLVELLNACESQDQDINAARFRADHHERIGVIDQLVRLGYIKGQNHVYRVSLTALVQLDSDTARRILSQSEVIWQYMFSHYKGQLDKPLAIGELADLPCEFRTN